MKFSKKKNQLQKICYAPSHKCVICAKIHIAF